MACLNADVSYVLRVAVIVLRVFCGHKFVVIGQKLNLDDRTVSQIYKRALQHTLETLRDLFFWISSNMWIPCHGRAGLQLFQKIQKHLHNEGNYFLSILSYLSKRFLRDGMF